MGSEIVVIRTEILKISAHISTMRVNATLREMAENLYTSLQSENKLLAGQYDGG